MDLWPIHRPENRPKADRTTNNNLPTNLHEAPPDYLELAYKPPGRERERERERDGETERRSETVRDL